MGEGRTFECEGCGHVFETSARRGRLPRACEDCDPHRARKRRYDRLIRLESDLLQRGIRQGTPSIERVAGLFVAVTRTKGARERVQALLDLAAAAVALANRLGG